ncbi:MAG: hypothetical protein Q9221_003005 [Calogaya cf. arnoldii]
MSPQRARKLKETCDSCSASKVKCEKQWPKCSRCENLGYPCFYSPAMRKGRPHPTINGNGQKRTTAEAVKPAKQQKIDPTVLQQHSRDDREQHHLSNGNGPIGVQHPTFQQLPLHLPHYPTQISASQNQPNPSLSRLNTLSPSTSTSSLSTLSPSASRSTKASSVTSTSSHDSHDFSNSEPSPSQSNNTHGSQGHTHNTDCASLAMQSLQALSAFSHCAPNSDHTFSNQLQTASTSIKHLSAMLICPCSGKAQIGLLNAAICATILDTYSSILRSAQDVVAGNSSEITQMMTGSEILSSSSMDGLPLSLSQNQQQRRFIIQSVLDELPKAANVVMQFSRRYNEMEGSGIDGEDDRVLAMLAMELRGRLKGMVGWATGMGAKGV